MGVARLVRRRVLESIAPARVVSPVAAARATVHLRQHSALARPRFSTPAFHGRVPQVLWPRARQQHSSAEEYAQALEHLQDRLAKYKKISRVLFGSAIGIFLALFFGINAVPEVTLALDKRKVRLASDLAMLEKQIEGVKEETASQQAFVRKTKLEEEQSAENAPSKE